MDGYIEHIKIHISEEKDVIDSFQGKEEYEKIMQDKGFYLSGVSNLLAITG